MPKKEYTATKTKDGQIYYYQLKGGKKVRVKKSIVPEEAKSRYSGKPIHHDLSKLEHEVDVLAMKAVMNRKPNKLKTYNFHTRILFRELKNDLEGLEFFLKFLKGYDPGAGTYFYDNVEDVKTFELYKKYNITAANLPEDAVTPSQWKYLYRIGYITKEDFKRGGA